MAIPQALESLVGQKVGEFEFKILYRIVDVSNNVAASWSPRIADALLSMFKQRETESGAVASFLQIRSRLVLVPAGTNPTIFTVGVAEANPDYDFDYGPDNDFGYGDGAVDRANISEIRQWVKKKFPTDIVELLNEEGWIEDQCELEPADPAMSDFIPTSDLPTETNPVVVLGEMRAEIDPPPGTDDPLGHTH